MTEFVATGTMIAEKYRVEKPVARGGFSTVYLGTQLGLNRPVALKLLDLSKNIETTWMARFEREAKLVSNLSHPNTITIIDYGREGRFLYIVMEFVRGRSLNRQIRKFGALDPGPVAQIALQVCRSLEEAHGYGILHRDLKPSNIMLATGKNDSPLIKVLDFGVAKILEPQPEVDLMLTQKGVFVGTPRYAAPEQLVHEAVDGRTDVYGVGMVMWEALVGDPAVPEIDYGACVEYHLGPQPWLLPDSIYCPPALADIVHKALRKRADERYQNISELADALQVFVKKQDVTLDETIESLLHSHDPSEPSIDLPADAIFAGIGRAASESEPTQDDALLLAPTRRDVSTQRLTLNKDQQPKKRRTLPALSETRPEDLDIDRSALPNENAPIETQEIEQKIRRKKQPSQTPTIVAIVAVSVLAVAVIYWVIQSNQRAEEIPEDIPEIVELTFGQDFLLTALKTTGWRVRLGDTVSYYDGVQQTQLSATKKGLRAQMTVFECETQKKTRTIIDQRPPGTMDVIFGTTLVRIRDKENGSGLAYETLTHLKELSLEKKP